MGSERLKPLQPLRFRAEVSQGRQANLPRDLRADSPIVILTLRVMGLLTRSVRTTMGGVQDSRSEHPQGFLRRRVRGLAAVGREDPDVLEAPQTDSAAEGGQVVTSTSARRQLFDLFGVAAADHDVIGHKGTHEGGYRASDCLPPLALANPLHPAAAKGVTERPLAIVRQPAQLQRDDNV